MNSSELRIRTKKRIKSLGLTKPGKGRTLVCAECHTSVLVHMNKPEMYTPEVIAQWKCYPCSIASKKGGEMKVVKKVVPVSTEAKKVNPKPSTSETKVAKVTDTKVKKPTVAETWVRILSSHVSKHTPDKTIASEMTKACPGHKVYTEADVARHRSIYNSGKFPCQKNIAPKVKLEKFVA